MPKNKIYTLVKWLIVIAALTYLGYKLITFDQYEEFIAQWREMPARSFWWLAGVILLLPLNLSLEALKWKTMVSNIQIISFRSAFQSVFAGITTGFFTPNRIGDMFGRIVFLDSENRTSGITISLLNSITQNLVIILCGIPACILFFSLKSNTFSGNIMLFILLSLGLLILLVLFYFFLPGLSKKLHNTRFGKKTERFTHCLSLYSTSELISIILITLSRYLVFSLQFFLMLRFFHIELTAWQAIITIPTNYLFVTLTPSIAFSEVAVRASYAVMLFGTFSDQTVNIALAGTAIWVVNWVIPLLAGTIIMLKSKI